MSKPFMAITKAMNSTLTAMKGIEGVKMDKAFQRAENDVLAASNAVEKMNMDLRNLGENDALPKQARSALEFNAALDVVHKGIRLAKSAIGEIGKLTALSDMQTQAETSLAVVLANQGAAYEDYQRILTEAAIMQDKTTISASAMTAAMGELATYISDIDALSALMPVFSDFAIGMGAGAAELGESTAVQYATALGKALDGQYEGLSKKGFAVTEAQKKIIEKGDEMARVGVIADIIGQSWDGLAETIALTDYGKITQMENATNSLKTSIGEQLYPYTLQLQQLLHGALNPALEFVAEHLNVIVPIVTVLGAGIGTLAVAIGVATAAQWLWNIAMTANPIVFVIAGITALVAAIAVLINKAGGLEIVWLKVSTGVINAISWMKEKSLLLLEGLVNGSIDGVNWLIEKLNKIPGVELSVIEKVTFGAETALAEQAKREARAEKSAARIAEIQAEKAAKAAEPRLAEKIFSSVGDIGNTLDDVVSGKAVRTKGDVKIEGEDLRMLLDISTMRYQAHYQTVTPQVRIGDVTINEPADVDYFINQLVDAVNEAADSSLSFGY